MCIRMAKFICIYVGMVLFAGMAVGDDVVRPVAPPVQPFDARSARSVVTSQKSYPTLDSQFDSTQFASDSRAENVVRAKDTSFSNSSTVIADLAYALEYNATNIYEFVRNEIHSDLYAGHKRSPERVLQDRVGNDCDQASLLIALLRASGLNANYRMGAVSFPVWGNNGQNLSTFLGVNSASNAFEILSAHLLPVYPPDENERVVDEYYTWVVLKNGSLEVEMDPFIKPYERSSGIDVSEWISYSRSDLYTMAGGNVGTHAVSELNSAAVDEYLNGLTTHLCAEFDRRLPNANVEDVLGSEKILPAKGIGSLCFTSYYASDYTNRTEFLWSCEFGIVVDGQWVYKPYPEIGTRTISVKTGAGGAGEVFLDDTVWLEGTIGGYSDGSYVIPIYSDAIRYVYNGQNYVPDTISETKYYPWRTETEYAFPVHLNPYGNRRAVDACAEALAQTLAGTQSGDPTLLSLQKIGAEYFHVRGLFQKVQDVCYGKTIHSLFGIGAFTQTAVPQSSCDIRHSSAVFYPNELSDREVAARGWARGLIGSAMEHGIWEQNQPGSIAVSSVRGISECSRGARTVFRVTSDNYAQIEPQLSGYSSTQLATFQSILSDSERLLILPATRVEVGNWVGATYLDVSTSGTIASVVDDTNGGVVVEPSRVGPTIVNEQNLSNTKKASNVDNPEGADPVDMATGSYLFNSTDLSVAGPLPLSFERNYSSSSSSSSGCLGYGWNHSLNLYVQEHSAPDKVLGRSLKELAGPIVAYHAMLDVLENEDTARSWTVANLIAEWMVDRLSQTAVTIYTGQEATTFIQQSDGSYIPPEGMTLSLMRTNGVYVMQKRNAETYTFNTDHLIDEIRDSDGNTLTFSYNAQNNLQAVTSSFGPVFTLGYTDDLLTSVRDNSSPARSIHYQYDVNSNLTNCVDAAGCSWSVGYDDQHQILWTKDGEKNFTVQNSYNAVGQVTNQISATDQPYKFFFAGNYSIEEDPYGHQTTYSFDSDGRVRSTKRANGSQSFTEFDGQNHVVRTVTPNGVTNAFAYDVSHNLLVATNALGTAEEVVTAYGYDSLQHCIAVTNAFGTAEQSVTEMTYTDTHHVDTITQAAGTSDEVVTDSDYDSNGLLQHLSEGNGARMTSYTYDAQGNPDVVTSTDTGAVDFDYDSRGMMQSLKNARGAETQYFYNEMGQMTRMENPDGTSVSKTYWKNGLLKTSTDARGKTAYHYWTPAYKPAGTVFPDGATTTNRYDAADRLIASRDALGNWTTNTLDSIGRPVSVASASTVVTHQFDAVGNVTNSVVDPAGLNLWSANEYDHLNRLKTARSAQSVNSFEYDVLGRVINRVDAASKNWGMEFDVFGRPVVSVRPSGARKTTGFNALGQRTVFRNAEGKPMYFGVDAQGRVTAITNAIGKVTAFTYDAVGNLNSRRDAGGALTEYGYDALDRLTAITNQGVEVATFDHDPNGNILSQSDNKGNEVEFGYDDMNRLTNSQLRVDSCSFVVQNSYDLNGNRTKIVYPGGLSVGYHYGADNRLESVSTDYAASTKEFSFAYDSANRLTGMDYPNGVHSTFGYDAESRITSIQHGDFVNREIHRNELGFKTTECINAGISPTIPTTQRSIKTHNDADQLISERVQQGTNWTNITYGYNDNGGLASVVAPDSDPEIFSYDYNNRLQSVSGGSSASTTQYLYDASGARIGRVHNSVTNYFVIDYVDGLKRPLAETDAQGNITRYYIWSGAHLLCHIEANGDTYYYHADELGSTLALTDESGAVSDQFAYMPYGTATHIGLTDTPFQWLGGYGVYYDIDTTLHLTLHRACSCSLKRFISPDPLGIDGGVNVYMWANMNPLFFVDPHGLCADSFPDRSSLMSGYSSRVSGTGSAGTTYWRQGIPGSGMSVSEWQRQQNKYAANDHFSMAMGMPPSAIVSTRNGPVYLDNQFQTDLAAVIPQAVGAGALGSVAAELGSSAYAAAEYQIYKWGAATSLSSPVLYETLKDPNPIRPTNFEVISPVINITADVIYGAASPPSYPANNSQAAGAVINTIFGN